MKESQGIGEYRKLLAAAADLMSCAEIASMHNVMSSVQKWHANVQSVIFDTHPT